MSASGGKRKRDAPAAAAKPISKGAGTHDLGQGAAVAYYPRAFPAQEAQALLRVLTSEVPWAEREIRVMGRMVMQPRKVAYMADSPSLSYTYSGVSVAAEPWHPAVAQIRARLEEITGASFNSCLLNLYRTGADNMGWHSDNEALYGREPVIGSVSFGAVRDFDLRRNDDHSHKLRFALGSGDILVMSGTCQDHWTHSVPKRANALGPRINLTFRKIVSPEQRVKAGGGRARAAGAAVAAAVGGGGAESAGPSAAAKAAGD